MSNIPHETDPSAHLLDPTTLHHLLASYGIAQVLQREVSDAAAAATAAAELGFPVALKVIASGVSHKSDVGGVKLGLQNHAEVLIAAQQMREAMATALPGAVPDGFLVQQMAKPGVEVIVGIKRDPVFGPVVMVGLGGVWVELLKDVQIALAPVTPIEAERLIRALRGAQLLSGFRGAPIADVPALTQILVQISQLAVERPDVVELDLNPVLVGPLGTGAVVVDARAVSSPVPNQPEQATDLPQRLQAMQAMFNPQHIAVIGASADPKKFGGRLVRYLKKHNYPGLISPVNPKESDVQGLPCYPSVLQVPGQVDLAAVMLPDHLVAAALTECGQRGIKAAIIYSSGFGEAGPEGVQRQNDVLAVANRYGIRLCGPNTVGVVSSVVSTCAAFGMAFEADDPPVGTVGLISQSGALGGSLISRGWAQGLGFSRWVATGNEADLTVSDYLLYLADDPETRVIALFLESIRDPQTFAEACRRAALNGKPILAYKTGRSAVGQQAVASHTGSLAGDDATYDAFFRKVGVIRVDDLQGLADAALAFSWQPIAHGRRIAVISTSGGACSVVADESDRLGLHVPALDPDIEAQVRALLPEFASPKNPIDVTMEANRRPEMMAEALALVMKDPGIDAALMMLTTNADPPAEVAARTIVAVAAQASKPVIVARTGAEFLAPKALALYQANRIPVFPMPDRAVRVLHTMALFSESQAQVIARQKWTQS